MTVDDRIGNADVPSGSCVEHGASLDKLLVSAPKRELPTWPKIDVESGT
ncbi:MULTISPECIES: hypothetical protein [Bacteria]|nr:MULTISPECIES: hypothetical protein [Bacteria]